MQERIATRSGGRTPATTARGAAERASVEGRNIASENLKQVAGGGEQTGSKSFSADAAGALSKSASPGEKGGGGDGGFNEDQPRDSYGRWT